MNGTFLRWQPYLSLCLLLLVSNSINVFTELQNRTWLGRPVAWWFPVMTEGTSAIAILACAWIAGLALAKVPVTAPWQRQAVTHLMGACLFSLLHVLGMAGLRALCNHLFDLDYYFRLSPEVMLYEFRKDVLSYVVIAAIFLAHGVGRPQAAARMPEGEAIPPAKVPALPTAPLGPPSLDIRDGARLLRVPIADILAAQSAGNYVEFLLKDGTRPLMRTTLTQLGKSLGAQGFLRTHRSWLVNPAHVRALAPEGSGDYALTLTDGQNIPLSRRYPQALAALRGEG
ncbi:LytTR family DNA-binding domain-containing protein [Niveispirillum irakense]|uniref:LytTR family DNA-binding domain-containing protein n=1 Tax=Niveispirillum irakense TaxID=34011 RepID=UPI0003F4BB62|nr:LytTR family DNA-binding domain-containing protein [Niveispirillum irakense]